MRPSVGRIRSRLLITSYIVLIAAVAIGIWPPHVWGTPPNFIVIVTDDQRADTMKYMPHTKQLIFEQGATFTNTFATTPLCNPSRASILTGLYARNHGARRNLDGLQLATFLTELRSVGYSTALIGKYLNYWTSGGPPGAGYFAVTPFGKADYRNPQLITPSGLQNRTGYLVDILRDEALAFIEQSHATGDSFALMLTPSTPHAPAIPAPEDKDALSSVRAHRPRNFGARNVRDKPSWIRKHIQRGDDPIARVDQFRLQQLRSLLSLDRAIKQIVERVIALGIDNNTVFIFISDNGLLWGEFGLNGKEAVYEGSVRVPLGIRFFNHIAPGTVRPEQVANIDIAPTIYDFAGVQPPYSMDGRSLVPLLAGDAAGWDREGLILEAWHRQTVKRTQYRAVHDLQHVYVIHDTGEEELYDLSTDPLELRNRANAPHYSSTLHALRDKLLRLEAQAIHP